MRVSRGGVRNKKGGHNSHRDDPICLASVRDAVRDHLTEFVRRECVPRLGGSHVDVAADVLGNFVAGGKYLRSTFMYLGWLCGGAADEAALRASASLELLHCFALMQDDVMDGSPLRRAQPAAHVVFARWHASNALAGSADRFGESAAVLLGDLCLVWAEEMLRRSGIGADALARVWPRYDQMRTELAIGQFADLVNSAQTLPSFDDVLDVLRRKSGNYTVRRPLEMGAAMANCGTEVLDALSGYGTAIGEAFQLRDDLLDVFGSPSVTGKPAGIDLMMQKTTSVVVAAHELAGPGVRRELVELMDGGEIDDASAERWRELIVRSGAVQYIEKHISERLTFALDVLEGAGITVATHEALCDMAFKCAKRAA
ncbi:polyprenyl synthetase [Mycobacterium shigaense]|uniref:Polyprenyl synthetase n=1 Tax=Mycobacterium shigaense TaxID=722731 RepID=A0A1Z4EF78_9MYCO|nr:polyprenyl synthetase [Mycobacterium shigaense]